jgi:hypothetical protein
LPLLVPRLSSTLWLRAVVVEYRDALGLVAVALVGLELLLVCLLLPERPTRLL